MSGICKNKFESSHNLGPLDRPGARCEQVGEKKITHLETGCKSVTRSSSSNIWTREAKKSSRVQCGGARANASMSADGLCTPSRYDPKEMTATRPLLPFVAFPDSDSPISLLKSPQFSASLLRLPLRLLRALVLATELLVLAAREGGSGRGGTETGEADLDLDLVDLDVLVDLDDALDDDVQLLMLPRLLLSHVDLAHPGLVGAVVVSSSLHWHRMSSRLLSTRRRLVSPSGVS